MNSQNLMNDFEELTIRFPEADLMEKLLIANRATFLHSYFGIIPR